MEGFVFYPSYWKAMEQMPMEHRGMFISAMAEYWETGVEPALEYPLNVAWELVKPNLDAHKKRKSDGKKGGLKRSGKYTSEADASILENSSKVTSEDDSTEEEVEEDKRIKDKRIKERESKKEEFVPPSLDDVKNAIAEDHLIHVSAEVFHSYYSSKKWKTGKDAMEDWRAVLLTWEAREKQKESAEKKKPKNQFHNFSERDTDYDALAEQLMM